MVFSPVSLVHAFVVAGTCPESTLPTRAQP
jgi:hypothetical protein